MSIKLIITLAVLASLVGAGGYAFYLGKDLTKLKFEKANEEPIPTANGFDIPIKVLVTNPSKITLPIDSIEYTGILEATGETLTQGRIENIRIIKESQTWINETARVTWTKTTEATLQLLQQENVWVDVRLNIRALGVINYPYSTKVDIKPALLGQVPAGNVVGGATNNLPTQNSSLVPNVL